MKITKERLEEIRQQLPQIAGRWLYADMKHGDVPDLIGGADDLLDAVDSLSERLVFMENALDQAIAGAEITLDDYGFPRVPRNPTRFQPLIEYRHIAAYLKEKS